MTMGKKASTVPQDGRDLRVPGAVSAAVRLGLAEIVQRVTNSTPLGTQQAVDHLRYELRILEAGYIHSENNAGGNDGKEVKG